MSTPAHSTDALVERRAPNGKRRYRAACTCGWRDDRTWGTAQRARQAGDQHRTYRRYAETVLAARGSR